MTRVGLVVSRNVMLDRRSFRFLSRLSSLLDRLTNGTVPLVGDTALTALHLSRGCLGEVICGFAVIDQWIVDVTQRNPVRRQHLALLSAAWSLFFFFFSVLFGGNNPISTSCCQAQKTSVWCIHLLCGGCAGQVHDVAGTAWQTTPYHTTPWSARLHSYADSPRQKEAHHTSSTATDTCMFVCLFVCLFVRSF